MEHSTELQELLGLMEHPAFITRQGIVQWENESAQALCILPGENLADYIFTGAEAYRQYAGGVLNLTLNHNGRQLDATVIRRNDADIFLLEPKQYEDSMRALSLASMTLRAPLSSAIQAAQELQAENPGLLRALTRMQRILCNMSDAGQLFKSKPELMSAGAVFDELFEKIQEYVERSGYRLEYTPLKETITCPLDEENVERAVMNLINNAMRFSPSGSCIYAKVTANDRFVCLQIMDTGSGIPPTIRGSVFSRYMREPGLEDPRYGLGLGLVLVRKIAADHGGAVLFNQPAAGGTRVTVTFNRASIVEPELHTSRQEIDYAGELDHGLLEFADNLPDSAFDGSWR